MAQIQILVAERVPAVRDAIHSVLVRHGFCVIPAPAADPSEQLLKAYPDLAIIGPSMATIQEITDFGETVRSNRITTPWLVLTNNSSEDLAVAALRAGAREYLRYPCSPAELARAARGSLENSGRKPAGLTPPAQHRLIGESAAMREVRAYLSRVAATSSNVLIIGETGTGKELAAEFLHRESPRRNKPYVTVNCAAIPDSLLESELFGFERGAFTGAHSASEGKLKAAQGGTVFLDEIGDMSPFAQAKILRATESKELQRLGGSGVSVDIRIIAATNQELDSLTRADRFRKDLFYRLNVAQVRLPPLRDRKEDIPDIAGFYLRTFAQLFGRAELRVADSTWPYLLAYEWPGNVRELKNFLEAASIHTSSKEITPADLPRHFHEQCPTTGDLSEKERRLLVDALVATNWNKTKAAHHLKWSRMTLYRKMAKYQLVDTESVRIPAAS